MKFRLLKMKLIQFGFGVALIVCMSVFSLHSSAEAVQIGPTDFVNATIINFDAFPGQCISNQYAGVTLSGGGFPCPGAGGIALIDGGNGTVLSVSNQIVGTFSNTHNRVGLDYFFLESDEVTLEIYDEGDILIETLSSPTNDNSGFEQSGFLGLQSSTEIKKFIIHDGPFDFKIDNLRYNSFNGNANNFSVPEPSSLILLGLGILTVGLLGRKRLKN